MAEKEERREALEGAIVPRSQEPGEGSRGELEVRIASELLERARAEGVSLVGKGGLLAGVTRQVHRPRRPEGAGRTPGRLGARATRNR